MVTTYSTDGVITVMKGFSTENKDEDVVSS